MKIRSIVAALFVLSLFASADSTSDKYPLEVAIFTVKANPGSAGKAGSGKADIKEAGSFTGVDFTYDCSMAFLSFGLERPYPAVWKEKGKVVTIHITKLGDASAKSECDLHVTMLPKIYAEKGGRLQTVSKAEFHELQEKAEKSERKLEHTKRTYMPLKVIFVESQWVSEGKLRIGKGKLNVIEKGATSGFQFTGKCVDVALQKTSSSGYVGKWNSDQTVLTIAAPAPGDAESPTCDLNVENHGTVYVKESDGKVNEVPFAEYNKKK